MRRRNSSLSNPRGLRAWHPTCRPHGPALCKVTNGHGMTLKGILPPVRNSRALLPAVPDDPPPGRPVQTAHPASGLADPAPVMGPKQ